jgi:DNA-binding transcriptional regulator YhcF (GntR family)/galactitol-specific phosphotransferase system IIB component
MASSRLLPISIDFQAPLPITLQISEQIKLLIAIGKLKPGDALPTVIQLAEYLQINHNTIAAVYAELVEADYLVARRGRGTFVAQTEVVQQALNRQHLYQLLEPAFRAADHMGLSASEFGATAYAQAISMSQRRVAPIQVVFVECLEHDAGSYLRSIQLEIDSPLLFLQLEDLQAGQPVALKNLRAADLVITNVDHVQEVVQLADPGQEVIGVVPEPDLQLLTKVSALPRNSQVLVVCQSFVGSETMKQMLERVGISHLNLQLASITSIQQNPQLLAKADVVYASQLVYDYVSKISSQSGKVIRFNFGIDQASATVVKVRSTIKQFGEEDDLNKR